MNAALHRIGYEHGASGCHGLMCGVLAINTNTLFSVWLNEVVGEIDPADILGKEVKRILCQAFEVVREQLLDPGFRFTLLLPDDNALLVQRLKALAQWCDGFLFGMALSVSNVDIELSQDSREILRDVVEITRVGISQAHDETDESAYAEIVEYLRIGVLVIVEEYRVDQAHLQEH